MTVPLQRISPSPLKLRFSVEGASKWQQTIVIRSLPTEEEPPLQPNSL